MRKPMTMVLSVFGLSVLSAFAGIINIKPQVETVISVTPIKEISEIQPELKVAKLPIVKNHSSFLNAVGHRESTNNYKAVNQFGYLGKYQFGKGTLKMYGVTNLVNYKNNPELQEKIFLMNVMRNKWILRREISWYSNRYLGGVYVSESGIIAAAHLSGPGNVKKYLRSHCDANLNKKDANGTSISDYMRIFKDYDIEDIPFERKPKL